MKKGTITIQGKEVFIYLAGIQVLEDNETSVKFTGLFSDIEKRSLTDRFNLEISGDCITVSKKNITQLNGIKF